MNWTMFVVVMAGLVAYHLICYFGVQYLEGTPRTVGWPIDEKIPYRPGFIYIYCSWFLCLVFVPALLYLHAPDMFVPVLKPSVTS